MKHKYVIVILVTNTLLFPPQRKLLVGISLIVAVSLFVVVANYSEKPYFRLQPMFKQGFSSHWIFSKQSYKDFKPHLGYVSIPKQEVRSSFLHLQTEATRESFFFSFGCFIWLYISILFNLVCKANNIWKYTVDAQWRYVLTLHTLNCVNLWGWGDVILETA